MKTFKTIFALSILCLGMSSYSQVTGLLASRFSVTETQKKSKKINERKIFSYDEKNGEVHFSDTNTESLKEINFYDNKNKLLASITNFDGEDLYKFSCWNSVHHIVIITNKTIHLEYID